MSHEIRMSHEQCQILARFIKQGELFYANASVEEIEEIDILGRLFAELPAEDDAATMTHGFCL